MAYIYDTDGNMLTTTKIYNHNKSENSIDVAGSQALLENQKCEVFILSSPSPYAYSGEIHAGGTRYLTIKLTRGQEKESRKAMRYNITGKALITTYICDGKRYGLLRPIEADLLNISTTGVRFRTRANTLSKHDEFTLRLKVGDSLKSLTAEVFNLRGVGRDSTEYGCALTGKDDG